MQLSRLEGFDYFEMLKEDSKRILEYKISRTEDKSLILEIKMDITDSVLDLATLTKETSPKQM